MDKAVATLYAQAFAARPAIRLTPETFGRRVETLCLAQGDRDAVLAGLHAGDLFLACACAAGDAAAIAAFEREVLAEVPAFVARFRGGAGFADEVAQRLRERLLVGAAPRIAEYGGRGPLRAWVRVAACRIAVDLRRAAGAHPTRTLDEAGALAGAAGADVQLLKARYRDHFQAALDGAIAALSPHQRTLLRMHHVDGYTLDRLATAHQVHRATVARRLAEARAQILDETRRRLGERLALSPSEVDSLAAVVQSQLKVSVERLLR